MEPSLSLKQKWRFAGVLVGGVLIHLSLGTLYTFGNLNPYITSYMRNRGVYSDLTYTECSWVFAVSCMGQGTAMTFGGILEQRFGIRIASLIGCWLMSLGVFLTYLTIQHSFIAVVFSYGLMFGLGTGLAYALPLSCAIKWMPHRKGLMSGLIVAGFGGGAFIFDQVQKVYINPGDAEATQKVDKDKYFTRDDVLDKVPSVFLLLGGCYATMQFVGCLLLAVPPSSVKMECSHLFDKKGANVDGGSYHRLEEEETSTLQQLSEGSQAQGSHLDKSDSNNYTPMQMVKTKHFYMIFLNFFFMGQGIVFVSTLYKAYGLSFISDDSFLSWTGTCAAVFNGLGRIFWGTLADKYCYKIAAMCMTCGFTCLLLTFQVTERTGDSLFLIYVCLLFGCFSGSFALFPTVTAKCFGSKYVARNYGIVFISQVLTSPIGVFAAHRLQEAVGWSGVFYYAAASAFIGFLLSILFDAKDINGKDI